MNIIHTYIYGLTTVCIHGSISFLWNNSAAQDLSLGTHSLSTIFRIVKLLWEASYANKMLFNEHLSIYISVFLNRGTVDILAHIICCRGYSVHCRVLSIILGLYQQMQGPPLLFRENQKCLSLLPNIHWVGTEFTLIFVKKHNFITVAIQPYIHVYQLQQVMICATYKTYPCQKKHFYFIHYKSNRCTPLNIFPE